jgi:hypothetical protein
LYVVIVSSAFAGVGVLSHIAGDIITPAGVRIFHPLLPKDVGGFSISEKKYCLDLVYADNTLANVGFFLLGGAALGAVGYLLFSETIVG